MLLKIKPGVRVNGLRNEVLLAINIAWGVMAAGGYETVITSVTDGGHSNASLHYAGQAFDLRSREIPKDRQEAMRQALAEALAWTPQDPGDFDVVLEGDHFHIEYQPKKGF